MGELVAEGFHISQRLRRLNRVQLPFQPSAAAHKPLQSQYERLLGSRTTDLRALLRGYRQALSNKLLLRAVTTSSFLRHAGSIDYSEAAVVRRRLAGVIQPAGGPSQIAVHLSKLFNIR